MSKFFVSCIMLHKFDRFKSHTQRTNGPVNAHLISYGEEMTLTLNTHIPS